MNFTHRKVFADPSVCFQFRSTPLERQPPTWEVDIYALPVCALLVDSLGSNLNSLPKNRKKKSQRRMIWKANGRNPMKSVVEEFCAHGDRSCTFPSSHSLEWMRIAPVRQLSAPPSARSHPEKITQFTSK